MPLLPGQTLQNRYSVVRVVKSGGMGAVYEARDGHLDGAACAVKEMLEQHVGTEDSDFIQRKFLEEKALLARLKHPGIPAVRDFFRLGQLCYIVMDYVHGANLEQELRDYEQLTGRPFPPDVLVRDVLQILDILVYLHGLDPPVVHRDIKPANLIREFKTGKVILVDFGLARHVSGSQTQSAVGTLGYSPLEQIQGKSEPRSDLYALGVTMNHMLTGTPPVPLSIPPLLEKDLSQDPRLAAVVDRACAMNPAQRFASAKDMREALLEWRVAEAQVAVAPVEEGPGVSAPVPNAPVSNAVSAPAQHTVSAPAQDAVSAPSWHTGALAMTGLAVALGLLFALPFRSGEPTPAPTPTLVMTSPAPPLPSPALAATEHREPSPMLTRRVTPTPKPTRRFPKATPQFVPKPAPPVAVPRLPPPPAIPVHVRTQRTPKPLETSVQVGGAHPTATPEALPSPPTQLSGQLRSVKFTGYALLLSIPVECQGGQLEASRERLEASYRQGDANLTREIHITAARGPELADFQKSQLRQLPREMLPIPYPKSLSWPDGTYYQVKQPPYFCIMLFVTGQEPGASKVQYEVKVSQTGPSASEEDVRQLAQLVLCSLRWKGGQGAGGPARRGGAGDWRRD